MKKEGKIGPGQLFCLLFASRFLSSFTCLKPDGKYPGLAEFLLFLLFGVLLSIPLLLYSNPMDTSPLRNDGISGGCVLNRSVLFIYAVYALWNASVNAARFDLFLGMLMFGNSDVTLLLLPLLISAAVLSAKGLETIGRFSFFVMLILFLTLGFSVGTTLGDFDPANLSLLFPEISEKTFKDSIEALSSTFELPMLWLVFPRVSGKKKLMLPLWFTAFALITGGTTAVIAGVTGLYGEKQIFRLHALTVLARIGAFERIDNLLCALWTLCALLRAGFAFFCVIRAAESIGKTEKSKKIAYAAVTGSVFLFAAVLTKKTALLSYVTRPVFTVPTFLLLYTALPLILRLRVPKSEKQSPKRRISV